MKLKDQTYSKTEVQELITEACKQLYDALLEVYMDSTQFNSKQVEDALKAHKDRIKV